MTWGAGEEWGVSVKEGLAPPARAKEVAVAASQAASLETAPAILTQLIV